MIRLLLGYIVLGLVDPASGFLTSLGGSQYTSTASAFSKASRGRQMTTAVHATLEPSLLTDLAVAGALGFGIDPLVELIFNGTHLERTDSDEANFKNSFIYGAADSIGTSAKVFGALALADFAAERFHLNLPIEVDLREAAPSVALTIWVALAACTIKRTLFLQAISGSQLGRVGLYDRLIDFLVASITTVVVFDELSIDLGMGLRSVLSAGGVGALVFSLASKDLAENIVGGFVLQAWDAFDVGDDVKLGDGTEGTVKKVGLVETEIVGYDSINVRIPNAQLSQRISNLSRIKQSRVKQPLRFKYSDLDKLPDALNAIKKEIQASCPKLITVDKPFHAVMTQYEPDHIQAVVICHFEIAPGTTEFMDNRQQMLLSVAKAVKESGVEFALPSIEYKTNDSSLL
jgi:small-conductance mechanosensitive channel